MRYAVLEEVSIDIKSAGTRTVLSDGGTMWQYRINSEAGKSVQVIFKKYLVPDNAELYLYNDCLLYTSPSPRDGLLSRMPSSA